MQNLKIILLLFFIHSIEAQTISGILISEENKTPIPFAHITILNEIGVVSNDEGNFSLHLNEKYQNEMVEISALGFETRKIPLKDFKPEMEISMKTTDLVLDEVVVGNYNNPALIINKYVENSKKNHFFDEQKFLSFTRQKETLLPTELDVEILEFRFQDKKQIQKHINEYTRKFKNKNTVFFREHLFEAHYLGKKTIINPIKALKLKDENGFDIYQFQDNFLLEMFSSLKSPYTYKIKSGIIPLEKDESLNDLAKNEKPFDTLSKKSFLNYKMYGLITNKEFINKPDRYEYTLEGVKKIQGFSCYHISFTPSKRKGKYKGNLYINVNDFALINYQYSLLEDKNEFSLNLKWVLGIKVNTFESSEEAQFASTKNGFYYPIFSRKTTSNYAYVHRSLTVTENNPKRSKRKKLKLDFKVELTSTSVDEVMIFEIDNTNEAEVSQLKPNDFVLYETKTKYDPNFWLPYNVLEATKEIKQFEVKN